MIRKLTCIECPVGCLLSASIKDSRVVNVSGHKCPKGEEYAQSEIENPVRILTSTVMTKNVSVRFLPVRTDRPIPKARIFDAMAKIQKICIRKPVKTGDIIAKNFLNLGVNLIATREINIS